MSEKPGYQPDLSDFDITFLSKTTEPAQQTETSESVQSPEDKGRLIDNLVSALERVKNYSIYQYGDQIQEEPFENDEELKAFSNTVMKTYLKKHARLFLDYSQNMRVL